MILRQFILFLACIGYLNASSCPKVSRHLNPGRRTRGDNGYKLIIGDNPIGYIPGKTYNLLLAGARTHEKIQYFTHFTITADATGSKKAVSTRRVGRFQLYADSLTKFNEKCVNTISEAEDLPKTEIQVMWVAPQAGSGCVTLSAMVYEGPGKWYADDGQLFKVICEYKPDSAAVQKECCACNEAKYKFVFEGIWSNETHPKDYPFAVWLTHFSDIVGATHESNFTFWGENHIATDAFKSLAEWGSPTALEEELRARGPQLRTLIKAPGLWYPDVNLNTSSTFRTDRKHHKVSMVSMFGPSPDWVVGVSGLDLCTEDCSWKESMIIPLTPWDAGTDSGISYMSSNAETFPREKMYKITTMYPEDPRAPFYNPKVAEIPPMAKLHIHLEKIIPRSCDDDFLKAIQSDIADNEDEDRRRECETSEFSPWSACSVTCGKGIRMRSRSYLDSQIAKQANCNKALITKEMCVARIPDCAGYQSDDEDEGENLAKSQPLVNSQGEGVGLCATTSWSNWNECSASCGIGIRMRTRTFTNHLGRKHCPHINVVEKEKCMQPECKFEDIELPDPDCPVSPWSDWSPCLLGATIRSRLVLLDDQNQISACAQKMKLSEQKHCKNPTPSDTFPSRDVCSLPVDSGPCRASYSRFGFNAANGKCELFHYGGCRGNQNNFMSEQECLKRCSTNSI